VLAQYLRQLATTEASFPNFNSLETWLILTPLPCCALLLISSIFLHRRVQILTMALAISTPRVQAFELKTPTTTAAPTTTASPILQWIDTFRQHDLVLISLVIGIIICMIIMQLQRIARLQDVHLYIDLSNSTQVVQLKLFCLPDSSRCYEVKLPRQNTQLVFRSYFFFGVLAFTSPPWTLSHSLTKKQIKLPRILLIAPWKLQKLHQIFLADHYIASPLVIHTHEFSYIHSTDGTTTDGSCPPYNNDQYGHVESHARGPAVPITARYQKHRQR
jgi:hypothetical protein